MILENKRNNPYETLVCTLMFEVAFIYSTVSGGSLTN